MRMQRTQVLDDEVAGSELGWHVQAEVRQTTHDICALLLRHVTDEARNAVDNAREKLNWFLPVVVSADRESDL